MAWALANASKTAAINPVATLANSGFIEVYDGTRPATPDTALGGGNHLLATLTFGATAFGGASNGVATANAITSGTCVRTGTASFIRVFKSDNTTVIGDGDCGTSGSDINFPTLSFVLNEVISCSSCTLTQP